VPNVRIEHMEIASPNTEFGIKGIGEGGAVGPPAAIVCAINDALRAKGAEIYKLPVTPERILDALQHARSTTALGSPI
jgi:carbon-monoxide dehydrogenase large subunit